MDHIAPGGLPLDHVGVGTVSPSRRQFLQTTLAVAAAGTLPGVAVGQAYPAKPIRLICPWPAGGATDAVMRAIAESAGKAPRRVHVGGEQGRRQRHAGPQRAGEGSAGRLTLSQLTIGVARLPHMQKMQFDPLKDFTHIACLTGYTFGIVVRSDSPIKSIEDLARVRQGKPEKFTHSTPGPHHAASGGGGVRGEGRHQALAYPVQGRSGGRAGRAWRPRDVAQRF